ncbi:hypothetical protein RS030_71142 [Cryptosporidium xiaoi]|uniref:Uncharacterized protein n=1 Tax=Cryptosporidium xiaoi TaxID=659607 RepID=A0AAV9XWS5_9CRYT
MEKSSENTLRVIESANRYLETHRKKFGMSPSKDRDKFEEIVSKRNKNILSLKNLEEKSHNKVNQSAPKSKVIQENILNDFQNESLSISEKKVIELENRISNILEYSLQLEKTIKTYFDDTKLNTNISNNSNMNNRCCCNSIDESKIASIVEKTVFSISSKSNNFKSPHKPRINLSHLDLERLSNQILDICFDEVIKNIDGVLENVSQKLLKTIV